MRSSIGCLFREQSPSTAAGGELRALLKHASIFRTDLSARSSVVPCTGIIACLVLLAVAAVSSSCLAVDEPAAKSDLGHSDGGRSSVESADQFSDAVQKLHDSEANVVQAREQAMRDLQSSPEYLAAVKELDTTYAAFNDKRNALLADLEKKDPRCAPMKKQVAEIDADIDSARQNPATTTDKFEELYRNRATFVHQWQDEVNSAIKRENMEPLRLQWEDASKKLADLCEQQRIDVENTDKVKSAKAAVAVAHAIVDQARSALDGPPPAEDTQEDQAEDYLRRFPHFGFGGTDAWWTYGWSPIYGNSPPAKPALK